MYKVTASLFALSLLLSGAAGAQSYDPSSGKSPLTLLEVPKDGSAYYETKVRARALMRERQYAEAEPLLERLAREYPRDPENWMLLGRAKSELKKHREAAAAFEKAGPLIGWGLQFGNGYDAAAAYLAAGNKRAALDMLRRVIFDQEHSTHRYNLYDWPQFAALRDDPEFLEIVGRPNMSRLSRDEGWRQDIDLLYSEAKRVNPDYRYAPFPAELERRYRELKQKVPSLSDNEIYAGMHHMLAPLHQGHIALWTSAESRVGMKQLPFQLYAFPEGIFIMDAGDEYKSLIGSRLLTIGKTPAEEALRKINQVQSTDGDMQYVGVGVKRLHVAQLLAGRGVIDSVDAADVTVQLPNGRRQKLTVRTSTVSRDSKITPLKAGNQPLFLSDRKQVHWERALPEHDALYVQLNNIENDKDETLAQFGRRLWTVVDAQKPANLILDLRHNNGGTTQQYPELLRTLITFSRIPGNQLYVLMGRETFSAAGNFVTDLERLTNPVFVGEASSECCNLHGDPAYILLPFSKISAELTSVHWQLSSPSDRRREMSPEVPVQLTAKAYFAGKDPALEAVFRLIAKRRQAAAVPAKGTE